MFLDIPNIDLTIQDSDGDTAFNLAVAQGKKNVVRRMIEMNPNVLNIVDNYGDTPIHAAYDNTEMLRTLIDAGGTRAIKLLGRRGKLVNGECMAHRYANENVVKIRQQKAMTVLEMAQASGNTSGVNYLRNFICY
jgi:ankyrin repeat protein